MKTRSPFLSMALLSLVVLGACSNSTTSPPPVDATSPAPVTDLLVLPAGDNSLTIQWTAPGDDGRTGTARSYKVCWSHSAINEANFADANPAANPPAPAAAGTVQQFTVTGLDTTLVNHFALRTVDEAGNASRVSNDAMLTLNGRVYIFAGNGQAGYGPVGQAPSSTQLYWPQDVVFAPDGSVIVLDWNNHRVIGVDKATGYFKLIVGVADGDFGDPCPPSPTPCTNILATNAKLNHPTHVAFDANGNMVLCAWHNSDLFLLNTSTGLMDRICGTGQRPCYNGDEQTAVTACVDLPASVAFDPAGRLCFTDQANMVIRMIDENGIIHTIAGTAPIWDPIGLRYNAQFGYSGDEGPATSAKLSFERGQIADPSGKICFDPAGNMYIADTRNYCVRRVDTNGVIHLFAGHPTLPGYGGDGSAATDASVYLNGPRDVASDLDGNIFIADTGNNVIRMVKTDGTISTVAGIQRPANSPPLPVDQLLAEDGKAAASVNFTAPTGVEVDSKGRLWIADTENNVIRILYR